MTRKQVMDAATATVGKVKTGDVAQRLRRYVRLVERDGTTAQWWRLLHALKRFGAVGQDVELDS